MTTAIPLQNASALTWQWVRMLIALMEVPARAEATRKPMSKSDEAVLADVQASLRGDGDAYARIINRYQNVLARRMTRFACDAGTVEELVHDVFVEAYYSLPKYRGDAPLEHWLQRIATRVGYRYWKTKRRAPSVSFQEELHDRAAADSQATDADASEQVAAVLGKLPLRDRLVLTLLYLESRSVAEAADLAGWSQTMVKVQAYRARKKVRKLLGESRPSKSTRSENDG
jgi:RNA polymerase sigma-70 factor (ECF subfamily)